MKVIRRFLCVVLGVFLVPALFAFAVGALGTVIGFITQPKIMGMLVLVLIGISIPGLILGFIIKK